MGFQIKIPYTYLGYIPCTYLVALGCEMHDLFHDETAHASTYKASGKVGTWQAEPKR